MWLTCYSCGLHAVLTTAQSQATDDRTAAKAEAVSTATPLKFDRKRHRHCSQLGEVGGYDGSGCLANRDYSAVDVLLADVHGVDPLLAAAVNGNATVVRRLLELGANPNAQAIGSKDTALLRACFFGSFCAVCGGRL